MAGMAVIMTGMRGADTKRATSGRVELRPAGASGLVGMAWTDLEGLAQVKIEGKIGVECLVPVSELRNFGTATSTAGRTQAVGGALVMDRELVSAPCRSVNLAQWRR